MQQYGEDHWGDFKVRLVCTCILGVVIWLVSMSGKGWARSGCNPHIREYTFVSKRASITSAFSSLFHVHRTLHLSNPLELTLYLSRLIYKHTHCYNVAVMLTILLSGLQDTLLGLLGACGAELSILKCANRVVAAGAQGQLCLIV